MNKPNPLINATSPYLLQHATNPVEWYPWGEEALQLAKQQNKPILLSVGYSACHWCHVMAHESFEDEETAAIMNQLFINIKVDREERPDLDKIYQLAHAVITQRSGGWPLTMFLTPDQVPFFGGTYFPKEPRYNLPAFKDLILRIAHYLKNNPEEIEKQNTSLLNFFNSLNQKESATHGPLRDEVLDKVTVELVAEFDADNGGFGDAPKFPHVGSIERALRHWASSKTQQADKRILHIAHHSLAKMALGGIYDQIGGGFCRYSVDEYWMIPHFEKMLYDNGPLLSLYSQAYLATGDALFKRTALETAAWVMRDMQAADGAYYATLDADSEGQEGKFYVWSADEVKNVLHADEYLYFSQQFGLDKPANFEGEWHLHTYITTEELAKTHSVDVETIHSHIQSAKSKLLAIRNDRVWPGRDEKILASWNGLMIQGMAIAARCFADETLLHSAQTALDFIQEKLWHEQRLFAVYKDRKAHTAGYLDDYAFLLDATLELLQSQWRSSYLTFAIELAEALLAHFLDSEKGGFFFTANDHEQLIHRPKSLADDATPSGAAVAAFALNRLGHIIGETRYIETAQQTLDAAAADIQQSPIAHCSFLHALEEMLTPPELLIIRGEDKAIKTWQTECMALYAPNRMVFAIAENEENLPKALSDKAAKPQTTAYICQNTQCLEPIDDLQMLIKTLKAR